MKFITPKTPPKHNRGLIELHSDDGWNGDYSHFLKLMISTAKKHSSWLRQTPLNSAINTNNIDKPYYMTWDDVAHIVRCGGEIHSHGKYHISLGYVKLAKPANIGDTKVTLTYNRQAQAEHELYTYDIYDSSNANNTSAKVSETFKLESIEGNIMHISEPLKKNHLSGMVVQITEESANDVMLKCKNEIEAHGFECNGHTFAFGDVNRVAIDRASNIFNSVRRTTGGYGFTHRENADINDLLTNQLESLMTNNKLDKSKADSLLNQIIDEDSFAIIRGHGEKMPERLEVLEYIVEQSILRGIKLVRRAEALNFLAKHQD